MMVQKARLFGDEAVAKQMLRTSDPKAHKALGRKVRGFDGKVWDQSMLIVSEFFVRMFIRVGANAKQTSSRSW